MVRAEKTRLLVFIADRAKVSAHDFELSVLTYVVRGHFENTQVEVREWGEGAACDEDYRRLGRISKNAGETVTGKLVVCQRIWVVALILRPH